MSKDKAHNEKFQKLLIGKTISRCSYMTEKTADDFGWYKRPLIIEFSDGSMLIPQMDDEGNDGGAVIYEDVPGKDNYDIIYTI